MSITYTKEEIMELRDLVIAEKNRNASLNSFESYTKTVRYITQLLEVYMDPKELEKQMKDYAEFSKHMPAGPYDTDYALAYDLLWGDLCSALLHINDALETVAVWRLKRGE